MKRILILLLWCPLSAVASDELRLTMHAQTAQQMRSSVKDLREIPRLQALCRAQLRKKYVPTACFETLILQSRRPEPWLIENCANAVPLVREIAILQRLAKNSALPDGCRSDLRKRRDDLRYSAETEAPATLFDAERVR